MYRCEMYKVSNSTSMLYHANKIYRTPVEGIQTTVNDLALPFPLALMITLRAVCISSLLLTRSGIASDLKQVEA